MTVLLFPDNTVLINFAVINRMDLLGRLVGDHGQWCATVAQECAASAARPELSALAAAGQIFGSPLHPEPAEHLETRVLRDSLARPGDGPHQHLGEAETIAIMSRRRITGFFVTDDRGAAALATQHGVRAVGTWHLLKLAAKADLVDPDTLWGYVQTLAARRRGRPPTVSDRPSFDKWLAI